jgi:sialic acid synthase SpsE
LRVGERRIGPGHPPYIIAELGVNHDGDRHRALQLVDAARAAGADAVKVQWFEADRLLSRAARLARYQETGGASNAFDMLRGLELEPDVIAEIVEHSSNAGLATIATLFSVDHVDTAVRCGFDAFKTASPDVVNRPLVEALMATGRPMLLSTGAATLTEIEAVTGWLGAHDHVLMHCVSAYPTPDDMACLAGRAAMYRINRNALGYSDHTMALDTGALAVAGGACVLEKHLTLNRTAAGPDHAMSLDPHGFEQYVRLAHRAHRMVGPPTKAPLAIELDVREVARQSVTTRCELPAGHVIEPGELTLKRPGGGIEPSRLSETIGRRLARPVAANTPLRDEDLA